jgi:hypothetical protein
MITFTRNITNQVAFAVVNVTNTCFAVRKVRSTDRAALVEGAISQLPGTVAVFDFSGNLIWQSFQARRGTMGSIFVEMVDLRFRHPEYDFRNNMYDD